MGDDRRVPGVWQLLSHLPARLPRIGCSRPSDDRLCDTLAGRSEKLQSKVLDAMVRSVHAIRATYGVSDYRWSALRDSSSVDQSIESQYGITRDDYSPKHAFATYRHLVARYSSAVAAPPSRRRDPARTSS